MPSFDIVSEVDGHELRNAVDQAGRELSKRFDFRGVDASFALEEGRIRLQAPEEFQLQQLTQILREKLAGRRVAPEVLEDAGIEASGKLKRQFFTIRQGIDRDLGRRLQKLVKDSRLKVQAAIQGDKVRVTGKKRDDLQKVIAMVREAELGVPLQFDNFRD